MTAIHQKQPIHESIQQVKKRNGQLVPFEQKKLALAISNAMHAVHDKAEEEDVDAVVSKVVEHLLQDHSETTPDVETIQDLVERSLMELGFYEVAKAYIVYRSRHQERREQEQQARLERIQTQQYFLVNQGEERVAFSLERIRTDFEAACEGVSELIDIERLVQKCLEGVFDGMSTSELSLLMVLTARSFIEQDPAYDLVTTRLALRRHDRMVLGDNITPDTREEAYRETFIRTIEELVDVGLLAEGMTSFDLPALAAELRPDRDEWFPYRGVQTLLDRYLLRGDDRDTPVETLQGFFMRVSMGLALNEAEPTRWATAFYHIISTFRFMPSTPTLFHAGTNHPQLSSCYISTVQDSLVDIFKAYSDNAMLSKWSGGLGNDWTNIRGMGAHIKSTGVESQGVIPFLKIANSTTSAINRSGKRRGAACAYLENWHIDIDDFLDLRRNTGDERRRTHDMNTAIWIPDLFMKRVAEQGQWTLFSPDETPDLHHLYGKEFEAAYEAYEAKAAQGEMEMVRTLPAVELWRKMITRLFETGHPWLTFKDPCNVRSPQDHVGTIHSSNLCTEITLNTSAEEVAVCNLGSVNLARHFENGAFSSSLIEETVTLAMRMLDNVIDLNLYPIPEAKTANMRHRPVGMGILGFQDALHLQKLAFESEDAMTFADRSMELISYHAILASSKLAAERGAYESYKGSKWDRGILPVDTIALLEEARGEQLAIPRGGVLDWGPVRESIRAHGMRNSNCMAIAPTATISNICGCFPSIEPVYKQLYVKSNMSGEFTVYNRFLIDALKDEGLWNDEFLQALKHYDGSIQSIPHVSGRLKGDFKTAFEIGPEWLIEAAARRGKWIDQSQSLNIFLQTTSGKRISEVYQLAWKKGLKTTYYLRTMGASGVEKSTVALSAASTPAASTAEPPATDIRVCGIDDPTCESCQ